MIINPRSEKSSTVISQDLKEGSGSLSWSREPLSLQLYGLPFESQDQIDLSARFDYPSRYAKLSLYNSTLFDQNDASELRFRNSFSASASGAVLFAGKHFAFSQPVLNSFALIIPDKSLEGVLLTTGKQEGRGTPLVLHTLAPYQRKTINLELPESDPDLVLSQSLFELLPSYRSGSIIHPRIRKTLHGDGQLLGQDGSPIALTALEITTPSGKKRLSFSDEEGRFQFHDLEAGFYLIQLRSDPSFQSSFQLEGRMRSPVSLGPIDVIQEKRL